MLCCMLRDKINSTLSMGVAFSLVFVGRSPISMKNDLRPEKGTVS